MLAARWHGQRDVRVEDIPEVGSPPEGWVKVKVAWCGLCGTDLEEYLHGPILIPTEPHPLSGRKAPLTMGHEISGQVVEVGRGVKHLREGDYVGLENSAFCGHCHWCSHHYPHLCERLVTLGLMDDGGFAEYVLAPAVTCVKLPEGMPLDTAALAEPLAVARRAVRQSRLQMGETVVIMGAGTIGLCILQLALAAGARQVFVVEKAPNRMELARRMGAHHVIDPSTTPPKPYVYDHTAGLGPDVVFECIGSAQAPAWAIEMGRKRGRVVLVGVYGEPSQVHLLDVVLNEKEIIGTLAHIYDQDYEEAVLALADRRVQLEPLITARIPLERIVEEGFERMIHDKTQQLKILVTPEKSRLATV